MGSIREKKPNTVTYYYYAEQVKACYGVFVSFSRIELVK